MVSLVFTALACFMLWSTTNQRALDWWVKHNPFWGLPEGTDLEKQTCIKVRLIGVGVMLIITLIISSVSDIRLNLEQQPQFVPYK